MLNDIELDYLGENKGRKKRAIEVEDHINKKTKLNQTMVYIEM